MMSGMAFWSSNDAQKLTHSISQPMWTVIQPLVSIATGLAGSSKTRSWHFLHVLASSTTSKLLAENSHGFRIELTRFFLAVESSKFPWF